jgi:plastocyanin domain-containing protein
MFNKNRIVGSLAGLGFFLTLTISSVLAQANKDVEMPASAGETSQFQKIEQPLGLKLAVALGGLGLIGAELWWFMFSKTKSQKAQVKQGIQEVDIVVDGGSNETVQNWTTLAKRAFLLSINLVLLSISSSFCLPRTKN